MSPRKAAGCRAFPCSDVTATASCGYRTRASAQATTFAHCGTSLIFCRAASVTGQAERRRPWAAALRDAEVVMCPLCIGSALLVLTGVGSAGGLAVIVARAAGASTAPHAPDSAE